MPSVRLRGTLTRNHGPGPILMKKAAKRALGLIAAFAIITAAALAGHAVAMRSGLERLRDAAGHRLDMVSAGLESDLARYEYLPSLLEMTPGVFDLLDAPGDVSLRDEVNRYLQGSVQQPEHPTCMCWTRPVSASPRPTGAIPAPRSVLICLFDPM